jgi:sRNA-binding carbon storage regulator CsrA
MARDIVPKTYAGKGCLVRRKPGETVRIGDDISVTIEPESFGRDILLRIKAPEALRITRPELDRLHERADEVA